MIPKHVRLGRWHFIWWPLKTPRGRCLQIRRDRSKDGNQVMRTLIDDSIADRFLTIKHKISERSGDYIYGSSRCMPDRLGWRFRQLLSTK